MATAARKSGGGDTQKSGGGDTPPYRGRGGTITKKQIVCLQATRRRLGIGDETYTEMKASVGVVSTKDLTQGQFEELVRRLVPHQGGAPDFPPLPQGEGGVRVGRATTETVERSCVPAAGWRSRHSSAAKSGMDKPVAAEKVPLMTKLEAMLADMSLPWSYADGIARNVCKVDKVRFCNAGQLYKVVQVLAVYQRRGGPKSKGKKSGESVNG